MLDKVCDQCFPDAIVIKRFSGDLELCEQKGKYFIVWGNGHKDDVVVTFETKPLPDPHPEDWTDEELETEEGKKICEIQDAWIDDCDKLHKSLLLAPGQGYFLYKDLQELGFAGNHDSEHPLLCQWLNHYCGLAVKEFEDRNG
jgi:hypothetical protein